MTRITRLWTGPSPLSPRRVRFYDTHQNVTEFWNVATRPANLNGFGLSAEETDRAVRVFEKGMTFLPDNEDV